MTSLEPLVRDLADRLRRFEIASLVYFHTDHFEPWRSIGSEVPAVGPEIVDSIHEFVRATQRIDFARHLTLFYKPHLNYALRRGDGLTRAHPDDLVGFLPRSDAEERYGRAAMGGVAAASRHEIQLHIHHEYYTATKTITDPAQIKWFAGPLGHELDASRLELAIRLNREIIARETGRTLDEWFFIHGQWALNASDDISCNITNEIDVLWRSGCRGDFTFPAGRGRTNPRIEVPYFCRPVDAPKGYDLPEAEPEIACGNRAAASRKFFIWACPAASLHCSIDYMSQSSRRHLDDTEKAAKALIEGSYRANRCLFIKTHGHSMHSFYFEHARSPVFPHQHPATQTLMSVIFDAATRAGVELRFLSASEAYHELIDAEMKPEIDLVTAYLRPPGPLHGILSAAGDKVGKRRANAARVQSAPSAEPLKNSAAIELVRDVVAKVLTRRIARLGVDGSGAYEHYNSALQRGYPLPVYELAALDIIRREVPRLGAACHEIGSGLGTLPFLLALHGIPAVAIERDRRRHETAVAIWSEIVARSGIEQNMCHLIHGSFPQIVARRDLSQSLAIFTDFVTTQSPERLAAIFEGLHRYRHVLLDLQRFCLKRETVEEQRTLLHDLAKRGFTGGRQFPELSVQDYTYVLFSNDAVAHGRGGAAIWSRLVASRRRRLAEVSADEAVERGKA